MTRKDDENISLLREFLVEELIETAQSDIFSVDSLTPSSTSLSTPSKFSPSSNTASSNDPMAHRENMTNNNFSRSNCTKNQVLNDINDTIGFLLQLNPPCNNSEKNMAIDTPLSPVSDCTYTPLYTNNHCPNLSQSVSNKYKSTVTISNSEYTRSYLNSASSQRLKQRSHPYCPILPKTQIIKSVGPPFVSHGKNTSISAPEQASDGIHILPMSRINRINENPENSFFTKDFKSSLPNNCQSNNLFVETPGNKIIDHGIVDTLLNIQEKTNLSKKQLRQIKNREAAEISRKRKREQLQNLENQIEILKEENDFLKSRISRIEESESQLKLENEQLKALLNKEPLNFVQSHKNSDREEDVRSFSSKSSFLTSFATDDEADKSSFFSSSPLFENAQVTLQSKPLSTFLMAFFFSFAFILSPSKTLNINSTSSVPLLINSANNIISIHPHNAHRFSPHHQLRIYAYKEYIKMNHHEQLPASVNNEIVSQSFNRLAIDTKFPSHPSSPYLKFSSYLPQTYQDIEDIVMSNIALDIPLTNLSQVFNLMLEQSSMDKRSSEDIAILHNLFGFSRSSHQYHHDEINHSPTMVLNISNTIKLLPYHFKKPDLSSEFPNKGAKYGQDKSGTATSAPPCYEYNSEHHCIHPCNDKNEQKEDTFPKFTMMTTLYYPSKPSTSVFGSLLQLDLQIVNAQLIGFKK